jgi:hypothetical protein
MPPDVHTLYIIGQQLLGRNRAGKVVWTMTLRLDGSYPV